MTAHPMRHRALALGVLLLTGCATLEPDKNLADVQQLTEGRTAGVAVELRRPAPDQDEATVAQWLATPLSAENAVRIALLGSPGVQQALLTLDLSDALRVQAGRLPNPHFSLGAFREGEQREIERALSFDLVGLLFLPWKSQWQSRQHELAKLQAAQDIARLATEVRKAWISAVAAEQSVRYLRDVQEAAEAGAELARRMTRVGNFSKLQQAREQLLVADAAAQLARAQQRAWSEREKLTRLLGLAGTQTQFTLAERLPDLPPQPIAQDDLEARALRERLDVRSAVAETAYVADSLGLVKTVGYLDGLTLSYKRASTVDGTGAQEVKRGWEVELALPIFDWGSARNARAETLYLQSAVRVRNVAVQARSEAREAYLGWRTAYDLARHYREEVVPLRRFIGDEMLLRYNGMLSSVWDLLGEIRAQSLAVNQALEAQRDFWLADADLQLTLTTTSPGALTQLRGASTSAAPAAQGH
ncbi:TolC family protein [Rhodoferax sp. BAB1]|nr:TolC family protein [Rhodoferax sp. BAB1]